MGKCSSSGVKYTSSFALSRLGKAGDPLCEALTERRGGEDRQSTQQRTRAETFHKPAGEFDEPAFRRAIRCCSNSLSPLFNALRLRFIVCFSASGCGWPYPLDWNLLFQLYASKIRLLLSGFARPKLHQRSKNWIMPRHSGFDCPTSAEMGKFETGSHATHLNVQFTETGSRLTATAGPQPAFGLEHLFLSLRKLRKHVLYEYGA